MAPDPPANPRRARSGGLTQDEIAQQQAEARIRARQKHFHDLNKHTAEVLEAINAEGVIVVDDEAESIARYLEAYAAEPSALRNLADEELDVNEDNAEWRMSASAAWEELTGAERRGLLAQSRAVLDRNNPMRGLSHLEALEKIFPTDTVLLIRPQDWRAQQETLAGGEAPPIVLFDQQLGSFGATGIELLEAYRDRRAESDPPAGILSNEINEAGDLTSLTPQERERIPAGSLMLISKLHLAEGHYDKAVALFRLTANLQHLHDARDSVLDGLRHDVAQAIADVQQLSPRVLEDLVYRSSRVEGAWEGETLARIAGLYLTRATRRREIADDLRAIVNRARRLSRRVERVEEIDDSSQAAAELHQIENFALAEWINGLKLPLANGDIFEVEHSKDDDKPQIGYFVMVGQPCDLVVRGDGVREASEARLLPIQVNLKPQEKLLEQPLASSPPQPVPTPAAILLKRGFNVDLGVLDLSWLNADGRSVIEDVDHPGTELMLTEGLTLRRDALVAHAAAALREIKKLKSRGQPLMRFGVAAQRSGRVSLDYDQGRPRRWCYPIRRVARLAPRQAEALLVRYSAGQARAAFDHELTKYSEDV